MVSTSHHEFGAQTTATEVAVAFSEQARSRTILITGVNKLGIGYATAAAFASQNADTIIIAGRSSNKLEECLESLSFEFPDVKFRQLLVDLSSQSSVRRAATEVLSWTDVRVIDLVINNAGIMLIPGRTLSQDGIELHFATNHVGHFLLTNLLAPKIIAAARSAERGATRIINVTSLACIVSGIRFSDHNWTSSSSTLPENERPNPALLKMSGLAADETMSYIAMGAYAASKSANSLFSVELNKRIFPKHGIVSVALHPGEIESELQRYVFYSPSSVVAHDPGLNPTRPHHC